MANKATLRRRWRELHVDTRRLLTLAGYGDEQGSD